MLVKRTRIRLNDARHLLLRNCRRHGLRAVGGHVREPDDIGRAHVAFQQDTSSGGCRETVTIVTANRIVFGTRDCLVYHATVSTRTRDVADHELLLT